MMLSATTVQNWKFPDKSSRGLEAEFGGEAGQTERDRWNKSLSEQFQIAKSEQAGYHCGNQLFCYIARKRPVLEPDHAFGLEKRADSSKRTVRHDEKKPQVRSKVQMTEHADSPGQLTPGRSNNFQKKF